MAPTSHKVCVLIQTAASISIESLSGTWTCHTPDQARAFAERFAARLGKRPEVFESGASWVKFEIDLGEFRLRGLDCLAPCLIVGDGDGIAGTIFTSFWQEVGARGKLPIFLCASESLLQQCREKIPAGRRLILSPRMIHGILDGANPRAFLGDLLHQQISRLLLSPFNVTKPVEGNMFFGRQHELRQLLEDDGSSYVVAGPSRIGKSSLLKQYQRELIRRRDPRLSRLYLIDFYDCSGCDADSVAQHIAFRIQEKQKTYTMTADKLCRFLKGQRQAHGGPLELVCDEVDEVCASDTFQLLAQSAKSGDVRLILCGRSPELLKLEFGTGSNACLRLQTLRPEPLDDVAARDLIRRPMADLGISLREESRLLEHICRVTGRLPHLLQYYGKHLVESAVEQSRDEVSMALVHCVESTYETLNFFVSPIHGLKDAGTKAIAVALLKDPRRQFTPEEIREVAIGLGQKPSIDEVYDNCNMLVMQNVLAWKDDQFHVACEGIRHFSRKAGLIRPV